MTDAGHRAADKRAGMIEKRMDHGVSDPQEQQWQDGKCKATLGLPASTCWPEGPVTLIVLNDVRDGGTAPHGRAG